MNLLDAVVTEVLSKPFFKWNKWWVEVNYDCCGRILKTELMFSSEEKAKMVRVGYKFLT